MEFMKIALENAGHLCPYFGKSLKWSMNVSKSLAIAAIVWLVFNPIAILGGGFTPTKFNFEFHKFG